jgi:hypothetical protein
LLLPGIAIINTPITNKIQQCINMYKVKYVPDKNHCFRICIELTHKYPENWCRIEKNISEHFTTMTARNWNLPYETVPDLKPWTTGIYDSSK